jgi:hypothetical protein
MDAALRAEAEKLREMGSAQAASHLIEHWPKSHRPTFVLMQHVSWKAPDQVRLAEHFLPKKPFADAFPYEVFASFMSVERFLAAMDRVWPTEAWDRQLLTYHLGPILDKYAASEGNKAAVREFLARHG